AELNLQTFADTGGNFDRGGGALATTTGAVARLAAVFDGLAGAAAAGAGAGLHDRAKECLPHLPEFTGAVTLAALRGAGPRLRAGTATGFTGVEPLKFDGHFGTVDGFDKIEGDIDTDVVALHGTATARSATT